MTNLRAPDPTLEALGDDLVDVALDLSVPVAHHVHGGCGFVLLAQLNAKHAAYFAVPCRECWPEAPERGDPTPCDDCITGAIHVRPGLHWQIALTPTR